MIRTLLAVLVLLQAAPTSLFADETAPTGLEKTVRGRLDGLDAKSTLYAKHLATGREVATLQGHKKAVYSLAYTADGQTLATGSTDNKVRLWDVSKIAR